MKSQFRLFSWLATISLLVPTLAAGEVIYRDSFEDLVSVDVVWASDATVLQGDALAALIDANLDTGEFELSSDELQNQNITLVPGDVLLLEGLAVVRMLTVNDVAGVTAVTSEPATLADAIESGTVDWDVSIGYEQLSQAKAYVGKIACTPAVDPDASSVSFSCTYNDYTMTLTVTSAGERAEIRYDIEQGSGPTARFSGIGTLDRFNSRGSLRYADGALDSWRYDSDSLSMQLRIELAAAGSNSSSLDYTLPVPMLKITIPQLAVFGISIDVGAQLIASLTVPAAASASALASANYSYTGDTGFVYEGANIETTATLNGHDFTDGMFDAAANFANVDAQFGLAFPRLGLSVLNQEVAWLHTGFIIGTSITFGPICKAGYAKLVVEGGYAVSILGVTLTEGKETFAERERRVSQNNCAG